jgi:hypothetical protein
MIADYAHRTSFVTLDLEPIFAQTKPTSVKISDLPYPDAVDATAALRE